MPIGRGSRQDGFIVPDDYLSEDEGADGEEVDMLISSGTKAKKERPQTVEPLVVISIGPVFDLNDKGASADLGGR